jgi:hypothetical protein
MNLSHHSDSRDQYVRPWLLVGRDAQNKSRIPELDSMCDEDLVWGLITKYFGSDSPMDD